jgi:hypothetical protein
MASLNHNFRLSETTIFLRHALDASGNTGGGTHVWRLTFVRHDLVVAWKCAQITRACQPTDRLRYRVQHLLAANM